MDGNPYLYESPSSLEVIIQRLEAQLLNSIDAVSYNLRDRGKTNIRLDDCARHLSLARQALKIANGQDDGSCMYPNFFGGSL